MKIDIVKETYIIKERFGVEEQMRDLRESPLVAVVFRPKGMINAFGV